MSTIKNGFIPTSNVNVHWKESNATTWSKPIIGGGSDRLSRGINNGLIIQAFEQNQNPKPIASSIKILSISPDGHIINVSYNTSTYEWTIGRGDKNSYNCTINVNVEIGP